MRDVIVIVLMCMAAIGIGTWLFFHGTNIGFPDSGANTVSYVVLGQGTNAVGVIARTNYRIQNQTDLESLWKLVYDGDAPAVPQIDFSKYEVLAVFDGQHASGGYGIRVTQVAEASGARKVFVEHKGPAAPCATLQAITSPFEIIKLPATSEPLTHEDDTVNGSCR